VLKIRNIPQRIEDGGIQNRLMNMNIVLSQLQGIYRGAPGYIELVNKYRFTHYSYVYNQSKGVFDIIHVINQELYSSSDESEEGVLYFKNLLKLLSEMTD